MNGFLRGPTTIFVVDDDEAVRDSITALLDAHGFRVEDFASIAEFVRGYRKLPRCCLILDHGMQPVTGLDFLESGEGRKLGIPVILITGQADTTIEQRAQNAGVAAFLEKPLPLKTLIDHIRNLTAQP
jgi:FixJ family two-component response regulator